MSKPDHPNASSEEELIGPSPDIGQNSMLTYNPTRANLTEVSMGDATKIISSGAEPTWQIMDGETPQEYAERKESSGAFSLLNKIGEGGFGEVWKASQNALGREVAVKRLRKKLRDESSDSHKLSKLLSVSFELEALTTAALEHPNIVPIHDMGTDENGHPLLAMKLVRGQPWENVLKKDFASLGFREYMRKHIRLFVDICQALAFAHSRGIMHRDIKPAQVMIGEFGEVLLMDWGLAVVFDHKMAGAGQVPNQNALTTSMESAPNPAGTAAFMAPEQTDQSTNRLGPWTDVYLLGATLYYILTRNPLRSGKFAYAIAQAKEGYYTPIDDQGMAPQIPTELKELINDCLEPDPEKRKEITASDLVEKLEDYLTGAGDQDKADELVDRLEKELEQALKNPQYRTLMACQSLLRRAREYWAQHPKYPVLENRILEGLAMCGVSNGDLSLARIYGEQITDQNIKDKVLGEVSVKETRVKTVRRQHKLLFFSFFFLIFLTIVAMIYYNSRIAEERSQLKESLQAQAQLNEAMNQRMKELACLYGVTDSLQHHNDYNQVFEMVCGLIPSAMQYPEITAVRLTYGGSVHTSDGFSESPWRMFSLIKVGGRIKGRIEVFYQEERPEMDEGPFLVQEGELVDAVANLLGEAISRGELEQRAGNLAYYIDERKKELACIYGVTNAVNQQDSIEDLAQDILELVPVAWQYPEVAQTRLTVGDRTWETLGFRESPYSQEAPIQKDGTVLGKIEVIYTVERPTEQEGPFLTEERLLINAIAETLALSPAVTSSE